jgi:hypothetical protein
MREDREAMMVVRAELCDRLERLRRLSGRHCRKDAKDSIEAMRVLAAAYRLTPVVRLTQALERAMAQDAASGRPPTLYLDRIRDAIGCERMDEDAAQAMIASVSVRLGA